MTIGELHGIPFPGAALPQEEGDRAATVLQSH